MRALFQSARGVFWNGLGRFVRNCAARYAVAFTLLILMGHPLRASAADDTTIGALLPLTGDGSFWGIRAKEGIDLARRDIAKETGAPARLKVIYKDDRCDPKAAVAAFHELVDIEHVHVIFGPVCSACVAAITPLLKNSHVLLVSFAEASFSEIGDHIFRLWIPSDREARLIAQDLFHRQGVDRAAVLLLDNTFGHDTADAFVDTFTSLGGRVVARESYPPDDRDMRAQLQRISAAHADGIFFISYLTDGIAIMRQFHELKLSVPVAGTSTVNSPEFFEAVGNIANGLTIADVPDHTAEQFRKRWEAMYHEEWPGAQSSAPLYYDATHLALEGAPYLHDGLAFRDFLLSHAQYDGVSGPLKFDKSGNLTLQHELLQVKGGKLDPVVEK